MIRFRARSISQVFKETGLATASPVMRVRTVNKGSVPKVPLEKMPLIDKPFKRVAIDLVRPVGLPSEDGHRYILTLVDLATRYS